MKTEVKVNNNDDASEWESADYFVQDYEGDTDSKQLIKVENAVKRKAEVNQETNVKKLKTEDNNVALSVRQIEV